ncbi:Odorant receptor 19 [Blattella germanica]|nr:Odorant receptor 19 [Blattella germanica]
MDIQTRLSAIHLSTECDRRMDLLGFMFKYLHFTFLGPSQETMNNTWKRRLYSLVQVIILFSYIPAIIGQAFGLCKYREDVEDISDILVSIVPLITFFPCSLYFITNWDNIKRFMLSMETESCFASPFVQSKNNLLQIIEGTKKKCIILTKVIVITEICGTCCFLFKPFVLDYLENQNRNLSEEEHVKNQWKKLMFLMWLPVDPRDPLIFYSIYTYQLFVCFVLFCHSTSIINFNFVLIRYSFIQFTLTCRAISETDVLTSCSKLESKNDSEVVKNENISSEIVAKSQSLSRDSNDIYINEETTEQADTESSEVYNYVRECTILHQSAISFAKEMNKLLSPLFVMNLLILSTVVVVSTFQLAMGGGVEKSLPYLSASMVVLMDTFALCWFGQQLMDESLAVEQAVYNTNWYDQPNSVKKLIYFIMMRSQNVVEIKETGFPNLSIETFSVILNASYQWFTILMNMVHE